MDRSQSKYIEINGINTRYFEKGSGDPIVLIHGGHLEEELVLKTGF